MTKRSGQMPEFLARSIRGIFVVMALALLATQQVYSQNNKTKSFSTQEIEQLVAPIALHPDDLIGQILMASTYPLQVVQAARWIKDNPKVKNKRLEEVMQTKPWDPSVKGLTAVPQVLQMMNEKLEWTQKLGDAVLAQKPDVLGAVQRLRAKARDKGNLKTTSQQTVKTETKESKTYIIVERSNPQVVYVPTYNPMVVYGAWPYHAYPPYYWYPPAYVATRAVWFGAGVAVGAAIWGTTSWHRGEVNINVNKYNSFNQTNVRSNNWNHNPQHRGAVPYRDQKTAKQYGRTARASSQRQSYRGYSGASRRSATTRQNQTQGRMTGSQGGTRPSRGTRREGSANLGRTGAGTRSASGVNHRSAYGGVGHGNQVRSQSNWGNRSLSSSRSNYGGGRSRSGGRRR